MHDDSSMSKFVEKNIDFDVKIPKFLVYVEK